MRCRHCGSELELKFLDLGSAPPSNAYLTAERLRAPETWFPLRLLVCETCWLVQTEDYAGREALFSDEYAYFSSYSTSWLDHARRYVAEMIGRLRLGPGSMVVEVAANDGYLLQFVKEASIPCYGIEPTASTAFAARSRGIEVIERFFGLELAVELAAKGRQADLVVANNVLAHVPDINDFLVGFGRLLKPAGVATFEFPHLLEMVQQNQFDTAYHEHYSYLSLGTAIRILQENGLAVFDVEQLPTHGGSLRVFAQRSDTGIRQRMPGVDLVLDRERQASMNSASFYAEFQLRADQVKNDFVAFLLDARRTGLKVAAYGAAAKGNTLINYAGIRQDTLPYIVDRNPAKQGKFLPGSRIPIVDESYLERKRPDRIVILPWNLREELMEQLSYARKWGAVFVTAIPGLEVV
jgi:SAM-dependent methyltransferase